MNPLGMSASATFLNGGFRVTPRFVVDVCKGGKSLLYKDNDGSQRDCDKKGEHREPPERVIHPAVSAVMMQMLRGPVDMPTGTVYSLRRGVIPGMDPLANIWSLKPAERAELEKRRIAFTLDLAGEIAGKTGTATNADGRTSDVWLLLFIPGPDANPEKGIMLIFWMGKDFKDHPLGERGIKGGAISGAETGGRNWTHAAATVLAFLQKERGYLKPGFKFQPMVKDDVFTNLMTRGIELQQEVGPDLDSSGIIDPSDPLISPELLKELPPEESEVPSLAVPTPQREGEPNPDALAD